MEPTLVEKPQITLVGLSFFGNPFAVSGGWTEENEIGRLWNRFMAYLTQHPGRIKHVLPENVSYEVHIEHEETRNTGEYEVFTGLEVTALEDVPVELSVKILPPVTYAVFTLRGQQIVSDWEKTIVSEWMSRSGYQSPYRYGFQLYDERFKGIQNIDESILDVYVPVTKIMG